MGKVVEVKISQMKIVSDIETKIMVPEIVSGVGVIMYDPVRCVCGAIHVILPRCFPGYQEDAMKFADTAIPILLEALMSRGAERNRLLVKIAGGAEGFFLQSKKLGTNNISSARDTIDKLELTIAAEDTGNHYKRDLAVFLDSTDCKIIVKRYGAPSISL